MHALNKFFSTLYIGYNHLGFYAFLIFFFCIYFTLPSKHHLKLIWIVAGNVFFYLQSGIAALLVIVAASLVVYAASRMIGRIYARFDLEKKKYSPKEQILLLKTYKKKSIVILIVSVLLILLALIFVKVCRLLGCKAVISFREFRLWESIIVPLGISYYSLSAIGYLLDIYWRKVKPERNFLYLAAAMTYFPIIVQGPISKYPNLMEQFKNLPRFDYKRATYGIQLILWGLFQKLVISDRLLIFSNSILNEVSNYSGIEVLVALIFSLIQIYTDFSGCMDIVQGVANIMGVQLKKNFNQPFFAKNGADYWRKWHISLGDWFRDYIYLPIYMNPFFMKITNKIKRKYGKGIGQLFVTVTISAIIWLLSGVWHGTGWNYVVWGLYWYGIIVLEEATTQFWGNIRMSLHIDEKRTYYTVWKSIKMFFIAVVGRIWTVGGNIQTCLIIWRQIFAEARLWTLFDSSIFTHGLDRKNFYLALLCIAVLWIVDLLHEKQIKIRDVISAQPLVVRWGIYYIAIFSIIIFGIYGPGYDAASFVYGGV